MDWENFIEYESLIIQKQFAGEIRFGPTFFSLNSNPEIIAEVAFYVKNRDSIKENFGKATFGEGVKATVDAITGKNAQQTPTSLNNAMNGKSSRHDSSPGEAATPRASLPSATA